MLRILVLGSAAGGGVPQWNSNSDACRRCRAGDPGVPARTQSSLAVSADGGRWLLLNASPDLRSQINATPALHPRDPARHGRRDSPVAGVVLTNGDIDHVAGLLSLREGHRFAVHGTDRVLAVLAGNPVFNVLPVERVPRRPLVLGQPFAATDADGVPLGLTVEAFPVPGKVALYLEDEAAGPDFGSRPGDTIGLRVTATATGRSFFYLPGCAAVPPDLADRLRGAALVFFDGTLWRDGEMVAQGAGPKTGRRMGHISMSGPDGSIAAFAPLEVARKVFIHVNNTNPVLLPDSPEREQAEAAGWQIAFDGMEVVL